MENKRYSRLNIPDWLKWVFAVTLLILIACFIYGIYLYNAIQQDKTSSFEDVKDEVMAETEIVTIDKVKRFHGDKAYYIIYGETNNNKQKIIYYPFSKNIEDITIVDKSEIISEESIRKGWNESCKNCNLFDITPALVGDKPSWEITFTDDSNRYVIDYLSIYDSTRIEQFRFNHMFK
ncbi:cell wall elongation regulator TseB-like domain-containing protein [Virgibacillus litoralis]|uniref:Uncharacterized protein YpmB n=1 Tax=Virgibacillus litoralis TaxID=578221 RepID=A0ABS4HF98_9BACI|nr:DUF5590 domain-containing protein [Virgibacillus litoralis]MBP1949591.1 uncharacterized protein YpmB [Virgibacillus litoralis]